MKRKISGVYKKIPRIIKLFSAIIITLFLLSFILIEGLIIRDAKNKNIENANYIIILGAGLNGANPSLALLQRLNAAIGYLKKNTNTDVIVSGGKGSRETVTEAEVMSKLLQNNGIEINRIILEDRSTSTYENLLYSGNLIDINKKVVIVSSGFHLFRAKNIAKKIGYKNIGGIAGKTPLLLLPNYYVREYLAVLKETITNNI
ncbi:MAG: YdcF family protein [Treponema sp.]|nr:YdcF family protein [Treponema sp.]